MLATKVIELLEKGDMVTFCFDDVGADIYQKDKTGIWYFDGYRQCESNCDNVFCKGKMKFVNEEGKSFFKCMLYYLPGGIKCPIKFIHKINFELDETLFEI